MAAQQTLEADRSIRETPPPWPGPECLLLSADGAMVPLHGGAWAEVRRWAVPSFSGVRTIPLKRAAACANGSASERRTNHPCNVGARWPDSRASSSSRGKPGAAGWTDAGGALNGDVAANRTHLAGPGPARMQGHAAGGAGRTVGGGVCAPIRLIAGGRQVSQHPSP